MSESNDNSEFDSYRKPWELNEHWELRRRFLEMHRDHYSQERLLCLAQTFINIEIMGNTYNDDVMAEIRRLIDDWDYVVQFRQQQQCLMQSKRTDLKKAAKKPRFESKPNDRNNQHDQSNNYMDRRNQSRSQYAEHPPSYPINRNQNLHPPPDSFDRHPYYNQPPTSMLAKSPINFRPPLNLPYANRKAQPKPDYDEIPSYETV